MFIFAFVVLLVMLVLIGFLIANVVYYNKIKNGTSLSTSQANSLFILNIIGLIIVVFIFFYAIFATIRSRRYTIATTTTVVSEDGTMTETVTTQDVATASSAPVVVPAPVPVAVRAPAPIARQGGAPVGSVPVSGVPPGKSLYRLTKTSQIPDGTVCAF